MHEITQRKCVKEVRLALTEHYQICQHMLAELKLAQDLRYAGLRNE